jgi:hypothetical protein
MIQKSKFYKTSITFLLILVNLLSIFHAELLHNTALSLNGQTHGQSVVPAPEGYKAAFSKECIACMLKDARLKPSTNNKICCDFIGQNTICLNQKDKLKQIHILSPHALRAPPSIS